MKKCRFLVFVFLTSCMVGPNYQEPKVKTPKKFSESKKNKNTSLINWWKKFEDPVLDQLVNQAFKKNYDINIAKERICQLKARYRITKADLFPQVDANARAIRSKISENLANSRFLGTQYQNFFEIGFDAIWEIDLFGKIRREKQAAAYAIQAQEEETNDVQLSVSAEVARLYVNIRYLQKKLSIFTRIQEVEKELAVLYKDRYSSGINSLLELEEAVTAYQNVTSELSRIDEALNETFYSLLTLLGKNPGDLTLKSLKNGPIPFIQTEVFGPSPSSLLRRRPDIRNAERKLAESTANIGSAVADLFPKFSLIGNYHQQSAETNKLFKSPSSSWNIGPIVDWPIITFGKIRANIDEKKSIQKQALLNYEKTITDAFNDVENAFNAYFKEEKFLYHSHLALDAKLKQQHLHNSLYQSGIEDRLDYLLSKKQALTQEDLVTDSQKNLTTNLISLYKALGGGF